MHMAHKQQAVAQMAAQGVPHVPIKTQHLEEEEAKAEEKAEEPKPEPAAEGAEGGDDSIDLMPPKNIKGGKGKALESSIEEAFEDKPNPDNSHYIADHTDKVLMFTVHCSMSLSEYLVSALVPSHRQQYAPSQAVKWATCGG